MGRWLRRTGLGIWALAIWVALAETAGWLPDGSADSWLWPGLWAGAAAVGLGMLLGVASPLGRELRRGRCVRCGVRIERGQTYCRDHVQAAVNEYRDRARDGLPGRPRGA